MKRFFKFGCGGILGIFVILLIISAMSDGKESEKTSSEPTETKQSEKEATKEKKAETPVKEETKSFKVGDLVKVGDMEYRITAKNVADQVGPSILPTKASGKFLVVDVTLKNNGNKAVTVDSSFFKLKRGEKIYEADTEGSMSANQGEDGNIDNSFFLQEVNPDSTITGKVVFDISPDIANVKDLQLQVQTGIFGTETEVINLQ